VRAPARTPAPRVRTPSPAVAPTAAPVVAPPAPPLVERAANNPGSLAELPESIQREVPRVTFGGYIYSPNPADRLLLVDKTLRHEGEEVAPGLVLEKLLPKAAVMNYKGYRYRVAY
jgi:general secretion pathway protein B